MKKAEYIIEIAKGNLSLDGYNYFVSLIKHCITKYNWPKTILDESTSNRNNWTDEDIISFVQQFLLFIQLKMR